MSEQYERITADEVEVGDRIARTRNAKFTEVVAIDEGPVSRRFWFGDSDSTNLRAPGRWNIRPRRTAKLWREVGGSNG